MIFRLLRLQTLRYCVLLVVSPCLKHNITALVAIPLRGLDSTYGTAYYGLHKVKPWYLANLTITSYSEVLGSLTLESRQKSTRHELGVVPGLYGYRHALILLNAYFLVDNAPLKPFMFQM